MAQAQPQFVELVVFIVVAVAVAVVVTIVTGAVICRREVAVDNVRNVNGRLHAEASPNAGRSLEHSPEASKRGCPPHGDVQSLRGRSDVPQRRSLRRACRKVHERHQRHR